MNFSFLSSEQGRCLVKLWATGRYGFSLPKKVEITTDAGQTTTFIYYNSKVGLKSELANHALVRIAIAQFLQAGLDPAALHGIDDTTPPFTGALTPIRPTSPAALPQRVRPGRSHARTSAPKEPRTA